MADPPRSTSIFGLDELFNNPVFAGGIGLAGLGAAAAFGRRFALRGASLLTRRLLVGLEISKQDASYQWVLSWLALPHPRSGFLTSRLTRIHHLSMKTTSRSSKNEPEHAHFFLQPGYGKYMIRHKNAFVQVNREKQSSASLDGREPHETITLTTLYANRDVFEDIFMEAHQLAATAYEGKTIMYTARGTEWVQFGEARRKRPLDSVILDIGIKERIVADVDDFLQRQEWYVERGIPYRRGYLLYGPPGSGKSSFIQALAGHLDFGIAIINLSERGMTDDKLAHLLTKLPRRTILLLEDADAAFRNRRQVDEDGYAGTNVTFSGLLNAMDGVAAGEERITFLTTNHIDRLDEALIRPGRVDMTVRIGEATRDQAAQMWDRFYYRAFDDDHHVRSGPRGCFLEKLERLGIIATRSGQYGTKKSPTSTAALQALFLFNKDDWKAAIANADGLVSKRLEMGKGIQTSGDAKGEKQKATLYTKVRPAKASASALYTNTCWLPPCRSNRALET